MAISRNNLCDWDDIANLFTNLNAARTKHALSGDIVVPSDSGYGTLIRTNVVRILKDGVLGLRDESHVRTIVSNMRVDVPQRGNLLYPEPLNNLNSTIDEILRTCHHDAFNTHDANFNSCPSDCSFSDGGSGCSVNFSHRSFGFSWDTSGGCPAFTCNFGVGKDNRVTDNFSACRDRGVSCVDLNRGGSCRPVAVG